MGCPTSLMSADVRRRLVPRLTPASLSKIWHVSSAIRRAWQRVIGRWHRNMDTHIVETRMFRPMLWHQSKPHVQRACRWGLILSRCSHFGSPQVSDMIECLMVRFAQMLRPCPSLQVFTRLHRSHSYRGEFAILCWIAEGVQRQRGPLASPKVSANSRVT